MKNHNEMVRSIASQISLLIASQDAELAAEIIQEQHPADIADILELLSEVDRLMIFQKLELGIAGDVLDEISTQATIDLVNKLPKEQIADILETLPDDDAAEIISEVPFTRASQVLSAVEPDEFLEISKLLEFPERSAGRIMTRKIVRLHEEWTVQDTMDRLRHLADSIDFAHLYVVDKEDHFVGVVPLRSLVTNDDKRLVQDIMKKDIVFVEATADQEEAAQLVERYDYLAIPVVDANKRLLGIITHDDVIDILTEEFTEDVQRMGGSAPLEKDYLSTTISTVFKKRIGWLLIMFVTEMFTGTVLRIYEEEIQAVVALSFYIPLLIGTGGNSGAQTTATVIRALAMEEVSPRDAWKLLWHEMRVGLALGVVMAIAGLIRALLWNTIPSLAITVSVSLLFIVLWANIVGSLLPLIATKLKIDPVVISSPVTSTLVDATGLIIYFSTAKLILQF